MRVGGDLGSVLVLYAAQFERVPLADASAVSGNVIKVCVELPWMVELVMCGFAMVVASGTRINRQIFLLQLLVYTWNNLQCTANVLNR